MNDYIGNVFHNMLTQPEGIDHAFAIGGFDARVGINVQILFTYNCFEGCDFFGGKLHGDVGVHFFKAKNRPEMLLLS